MESRSANANTRRDVTLGQENETGNGWSYDISIRWESGRETAHTLTLSWSDHDLIAGGHVPPSRTARAAIESALASESVQFREADLPPRVDVSTLRRMIAGFDAIVRALLK